MQGDAVADREGCDAEALIRVRPGMRDACERVAPAQVFGVDLRFSRRKCKGVVQKGES